MNERYVRKNVAQYYRTPLYWRSSLDPATVQKATFKLVFVVQVHIDNRIVRSVNASLTFAARPLLRFVDVCGAQNPTATCGV